MEEIVGQAKWTTTNHTKVWSSSKEGDVVYMCIWWDWKWVIYYELLPENQMINSNKYCSQLDQLKTALNEKRLELVNRKRIISHQDNARLHVFWWPGKTVTAWLGSSDSSAIFTRRCTFGFPFTSVFKNSLNGKNFNSLEDCKRHLEQFFAQKD